MILQNYFVCDIVLLSLFRGIGFSLFFKLKTEQLRKTISKLFRINIKQM